MNSVGLESSVRLGISTSLVNVELDGELVSPVDIDVSRVHVVELDKFVSPTDFDGSSVINSAVGISTFYDGRQTVESDQDATMSSTLTFESDQSLVEYDPGSTDMIHNPGGIGKIYDPGEVKMKCEEAELVHIDEQPMNIDDDLGHINEAFMMMDEQLDIHIS